MNYTISEARNKLHRLLKEAETGACVTITKRGVPVAKIVRKFEKLPRERLFGVLGNKNVVLDPDWARPQDNLNAWLAGDV